MRPDHLLTASQAEDTASAMNDAEIKISLDAVLSAIGRLVAAYEYALITRDRKIVMLTRDLLRK